MASACSSLPKRDAPEWMTFYRAMVLMGHGPQWLRRKIRAGRFRANKRGSRTCWSWLISTKSLLAYEDATRMHGSRALGVVFPRTQISTAEAALRWNTSAQAVRYRVREGQLEAYRHSATDITVALEAVSAAVFSI